MNFCLVLFGFYFIWDSNQWCYLVTPVLCTNCYHVNGNDADIKIVVKVPRYSITDLLLSVLFDN